MKRMTHTLLLIILFAMFCPMLVYAATVYTEGYFKYQIEEESITICEYYGKDAEVTVPSMMVGMPVSKIAKGAFAGNTSVKTVNLPDTVMTVEGGAFASGIQVVYNSNTDNPVASGSKNEETADSEGETENTGMGAGQTGNTGTGNGQAGNVGIGNGQTEKTESIQDGSGIGKTSQNREEPGIEEAEVELDDAFFKEEKQTADPSGEEEQTAGSIREEEADNEESESEEKEDRADREDKEKETENDERPEEEAEAEGSAAPIAAAVIIIIAAIAIFLWKKRKN